MDLIYSEKPVEILMKRGTPKIKNLTNIDELVLEIEMKHANLLKEFANYCQTTEQFDIYKDLSKAEKIRLREIYFLRNILLLGRDYLSLFLKPNLSIKTFYITPTHSNLTISKKAKKKILSKVDSHRCLSELEKLTNFSKKLRLQL